MKVHSLRALVVWVVGHVLGVGDDVVFGLELDLGGQQHMPVGRHRAAES